MSFEELKVRRRLIYEERVGVHLRRRDNRKSGEYAESVARLKAAAAREAKQQES